MKIKKRLFCTALTALSFTTAAFASYPVTVRAVGEQPTFSTFVMQNGASVRLKENSNGLRFAAEISETEYNNLKAANAKFGMLIVAKDLLKDTELSPTSVFGENSPFYFTNEVETPPENKKAMLHISSPACENIDDDPAIEICGAIIDIETYNFTRSFVGVAYVAIPNTTTTEETSSMESDTSGETEREVTYTYHFAPYYNNDIANNTRCMYYVAQASIEINKYVTELNDLYITPFSQTDRYTKYHYAYYVNHHYRVHDEETQEHVTVYTTRTRHFAQLNSTVTAEPIEKPTDTGVAEMEGNFIFDTQTSSANRSGLVYAAGMQVFDLYYELATDLSEEQKDKTLAELVADFLKVENAPENFGLIKDETGTTGAWIPSATEDGNGINLHTTSPSSDRTLILSKYFFDHLRAYGVDTVTFTLRTGDSKNKTIRYAIYQEELDANGRDQLLDVYNTAGEKLLDSSNVEEERVTLKLLDITHAGGVRIELHNSASSNVGDYVFENIEFTFPTQSVQDNA